MTLKTINIDSGVFMTGDAEMLRVIYLHILALVIFYCMTADTLFKAVF